MATTPEWLVEFVDRVAAEALSLKSQGDLSCHLFRNSSRAGDEWEVTLFPDASEMAGQVRFSWQFVFSIDVAGILSQFTTVSSCRWQTESVGDDDDLGAHLSIEGSSAGHAIWLRILSVQPRRLAQQTPGNRPLV